MYFIYLFILLFHSEYFFTNLYVSENFYDSNSPKHACEGKETKRFYFQ